MRKFLALLIFLNLFLACNKLDEYTKFNIVYHTEAVIPARVSLNLPMDIPLPSITTESNHTFENHNTHKDLIEEIHLKELKVKITDPVNGDFSFLSDIEIYISADGLPEIKIAWLNNIPDSIGNEIILETTGSDLQEYIKTDSFNLRLRVTTDQLITQDYTIDIKSVFEVNAKILGI